jgi:hypothetical protein
MAICTGTIPLKDVYDNWIRDQIHRAYFQGMTMVIRATYIGQEIATENLSQRFHKLSQRNYDPATKKVRYLMVRSFHHSELLSLLEETADMSNQEIQQNVPELDRIFYNGLILRLQDRPPLAAHLQHPASNTLGENITRLNQILATAVNEERNMDQLVQISQQSSGNFRRTTEHSRS